MTRILAGFLFISSSINHPMELLKKYCIDFYQQLIKMDDTPMRIAVSFGVGVFLGILPLTGIVAALGVAFLFKLNKPAVMLGCVLTNSWLSIVTFLISLKIGALILGLNWITIEQQVHDLMQHFSLKLFFDAALFSILKPLFIGYAIVGLICGAVSSVVVLFLLKMQRKPPC